jgi:Zn-finger nucleic acid-binding protein
MKCPVCPDTDLLMTERSGIEIDYCPQCRGVWLDRGELDKIIERSLHEAVPISTAPAAHCQAPQQFGHGHHDKHHYDKHHDSHHGYHGKQSFWKELFD